MRRISWAMGAGKFCKRGSRGSIVMRTAKVEQVKAGLFQGRTDGILRITNMRTAHEFGGRVSYLNGNSSILSQCWSHESVININMKALTLFPLVQQLPLSIRY